MEVMLHAYMQLTIFSPNHMAVLFVCKLSSVLCKGHFFYKFHKKFIDNRMLP